LRELLMMLSDGKGGLGVPMKGPCGQLRLPEAIPVPNFKEKFVYSFKKESEWLYELCLKVPNKGREM
jgi:hypothetical protein